MKSLAEKVKKEVGLVTILVNNAGIMPCRQFSAYSPEDIQKLFGVNVFAHIWVCVYLLQIFSLVNLYRKYTFKNKEIIKYIEHDRSIF